MVPFDVELADEVVVLRPFQTSDRAELIEGRDSVFHAVLGEGSPEPTPAA